MADTQSAAHRSFVWSLRLSRLGRHLTGRDTRWPGEHVQRYWHAPVLATPRRSRLIGLAGLVLVLALLGCAGLPRLSAVPQSSTDRATVLGIPNARFFPDTQTPAMIQEAMTARERERKALGIMPGSPLPTASFLAISGGSDDGAFGAGVLTGWTETGTRPDFKIVTGISTGALTAPFAFLGPKYDPELRDVYTSIRPSNVFELRSWLNIPFSDSMADTTPLFRMISRYVNEDMLTAIAREYAKGRLLLIGTTDLDVQRPVFWNIGAIAASGNPAALDLFRRVLLASTSVPVFFPPVMIDVEMDGHRYAEMHVDGGAVAQMFLYPPTVGRLVDLQRGIHARDRRAFVIRNSRLDPEWASVDRRLLTVATRAISTMIQYSGQNDIWRIQTTCERDGVEFNLAYIGSDFKVKRKENFDPDYMRALFDYGHSQARAGYPWYKGHPALSALSSAPRAKSGSRAVGNAQSSAGANSPQSSGLLGAKLGTPREEATVAGPHLHPFPPAVDVGVR